MAHQGNYKAIQQEIIAQTLVDPDFRARFVEDPRGVLEEKGIPRSETPHFVLVEDSAEKFHMILPPAPVEGPLDDDDLEAIAAGGSCCSMHCLGSW